MDLALATGTGPEAWGLEVDGQCVASFILALERRSRPRRG